MEVQPAAKSPAHSGSVSASSTSSYEHDDLLTNPYELRHGRRYLRDMPYPLPCDLPEMHRQSLRTLLCMSVFNGAACAPLLRQKPPMKVLELGCGGAYWTASCYDHFKSMGRSNISFTGLDMAPIAPDLRRHGIDWRFVQHDLRRIPWPFQNGEFDFVMIKDMALVVPLGVPWQRFLEEATRIMKKGGTLELWDSDHVLRRLLPHQPLCSEPESRAEKAARKTCTFVIGAGVPFAAAQNKYIEQCNAWIAAALGKRHLQATPCARVVETLHQWPVALESIDCCRIAVPLKILPWEPDRRKHSRSGTSAKAHNAGKARAKPTASMLTPDQAALRQVALMIVVQKCESLEPVLREVSGKSAEEWATWWTTKMADLLKSDEIGTGECLELGAWWATKKST